MALIAVFDASNGVAGRAAVTDTVGWRVISENTCNVINDDAHLHEDKGQCPGMKDTPSVTHTRMDPAKCRRNISILNLRD